MLKFFNSIVIFTLVIIACFLYKKYEDKMMIKENDDYYLIRKHFLIDEHTISFSKKPMMFIHIEYEYNSRKWLSFGSRSSCEINIPFLYFTLKSIILNCDKYNFHLFYSNDGYSLTCSRNLFSYTNNNLWFNVNFLSSHYVAGF
jgi:hypothetical protein